jgi:signal transduction histidine kinase
VTNLGHELRTPLSAILGFVTLLLPDARPDQRVGLGHIQSGGRRLEATVENLIDLTELEERKLRPRPLDLMTLLRQATEAASAAAADKRVTLNVAASDAALPQITADGWAVRRIVDNLVSNAIKFTAQGGSVVLSAQRVADGVAARIEDTGTGMPSEVLRQIGEPFFQAEAGAGRRFEGMGTGLALSLGLAGMMGATLTCDSVPGKGTTASLFFPYASR